MISTEKPSWRGHVQWLCEKWSEEAVDFARRKLEKEGVTHIEMGYEIRPSRVRDRIASVIAGRDVCVPVFAPKLVAIEHGISSSVLRALVGDPEIVEEVAGNLLLNEGIQEIWDLVIAAGGTTSYANANAQIGVGDSSTAEAATQTDLQAATNKLYKAMNATYPSRANQTVTFQSDFTTSEANYAWNEWTVRNGATRDKNLQRKVASLGTKTTGTWTLSAAITLS